MARQLSLPASLHGRLATLVHATRAPADQAFKAVVRRKAARAHATRDVGMRQTRWPYAKTSFSITVYRLRLVMMPLSCAKQSVMVGRLPCANTICCGCSAALALARRLASFSGRESPTVALHIAMVG